MFKKKRYVYFLSCAIREHTRKTGKTYSKGYLNLEQHRDKKIKSIFDIIDVGKTIEEQRGFPSGSVVVLNFFILRREKREFNECLIST